MMLQMYQKMWIEIVSNIPKWSTIDVGRILFNIKDKKIYLGLSGNSKKWKVIGGFNYITSDQINWNTDFDNDFAVDAYDIPMKLELEDSSSLVSYCYSNSFVYHNVGDTLNYFS